MRYAARMSVTLQGSLLDTGDRLELHTLATGLQRTPLTRGAWVDYRSGWLGGAGGSRDDVRRAVPRRAVARGAPRDVRAHGRRPPAAEVLRRGRAAPPPAAGPGSRAA